MTQTKPPLTTFRNEFLEDMFPEERLIVGTSTSKNLLSDAVGVFNRPAASYIWSEPLVDRDTPEQGIKFLNLHQATTFFKMLASLPIERGLSEVSFTEYTIVDICNVYRDRLGRAGVFFVRTCAKGGFDIITVSSPYAKGSKFGDCLVPHSPKNVLDPHYWKEGVGVESGPPEFVRGLESNMKGLFMLVVPEWIFSRKN